jgi:hypothetical protein
LLGITGSHFTIKRDRIGIIEGTSKGGKDSFVDLANKRPWTRNENPNMDDPDIICMPPGSHRAGTDNGNGL